VLLDFIGTRLASDAVRSHLPTMHPEDTTPRSKVTGVKLEVMLAIISGTYGSGRAYTCHQLRMRNRFAPQEGPGRPLVFS